MLWVLAREPSRAAGLPVLMNGNFFQIRVLFPHSSAFECSNIIKEVDPSSSTWLSLKAVSIPIMSRYCLPPCSTKTCKRYMYITRETLFLVGLPKAVNPGQFHILLWFCNPDLSAQISLSCLWFCWQAKATPDFSNTHNSSWKRRLSVILTSLSTGANGNATNPTTVTVNLEHFPHGFRWFCSRSSWFRSSGGCHFFPVAYQLMPW